MFDFALAYGLPRRGGAFGREAKTGPARAWAAEARAAAAGPVADDPAYLPCPVDTAAQAALSAAWQTLVKAQDPAQGHPSDMAHCLAHAFGTALGDYARSGAGSAQIEALERIVHRARARRESRPRPDPHNMPGDMREKCAPVSDGPGRATALSGGGSETA